MGSKQYVVPTKRMTFAEESKYRLFALATGIYYSFKTNITPWDRAEIPAKGMDLSIDDVLAFLIAGRWPRALDVRRWRNIDEAGTVLDSWRTAALAVIDTEYSCLQAIAVAPAALRARKLVVFYNVTLGTGGSGVGPMIPNPVTRLIFRRQVAAGPVMAQFDLEELDAAEVPQGYLSDPVVWEPNTPYALNALARIATGAIARIIPGTFVFELAGQTSGL